MDAPTTPKSARRNLFAETERSPARKATTFEESEEMEQPRTTEMSKYSFLNPACQAAGDAALPAKFEHLYKSFFWLEAVSSIVSRRNKLIVFEEVARDVKRKTHCDFNVQMMNQILSVYPNAYTMEWKERSSGPIVTPSKKYELVLTPNLKDDLESFWLPPSPSKIQQPQFGSPKKLTSVNVSPRKRTPFLPQSPQKTPQKATPQQRALILCHSERLECWRVACRRDIFRYKLLRLIKEAHEDFCASNGGPDETVIMPGSYHSKFDMNRDVPDIVPAVIPPTPKPALKRKLNFDDIEEVKLPKIEEVQLPASVTENLEQLRSPVKELSVNGKVPLSPTKFASAVASTATPKKSMYERILEKQRLREAMNTPAKIAMEQRQGNLKKLHDQVLYSVHGAFQSHKKTTLAMPFLSTEIMKDCGDLSESQCTALIELLAEVASTHYQVVSVRQTKHVKLLSTADKYSVVKEMLFLEIKKCGNTLN